MATIKSYTDIEQSKKLAKILSIESADMWHHGFFNPSRMCKIEYNPPAPYHSVTHQWDCPCWSLTALLSVMPKINEWITPYGHKNDKLFQFEPRICKIWEHSIIPSYKVTYDNGLSTDIYDNPVDACYEMIIKLHELNLL